MISDYKFKKPDAAWRGAPFWSWNDDLEEKEIKWQIRSMKKAGLGGFFMHSRVGLITPYLGRKWMDIVKGATKEAKRIGMYAYLYDEDKWPSGFAGGFVPLRNSEFRKKSLVCMNKEADVDGFKLIKKAKISGKKYYFYLRISTTGSWWFNRTCYVDLLNPDVTDAFIDTTYKAYKDEVGREFGKAVPAIFTDEPSVGAFFGAEHFIKTVPWTDEFPEYFKKKNGYDILKQLPSLFFNKDNTRKIKHDYFKTVTEMFVENFTKRIGNWCARNKIAFTGHMLHEDTFHSQTLCVGAAMPHYEYMQWPGIDHLGWHIGEPLKNYPAYAGEAEDNSPMHATMKQVTSVAHQFEKERVLSELYGVSGWDFTFEGQKWIGDWEYVLGVNLRCQHLALYSLKGCRKRDYPPSIHYQQRWWKYYNLVEDYFGRLGYMLTRGKFSADVLLLHSISSAWCVFDKETMKKEEFFDEFIDVSIWLSGMHRDYDYGDEMIISRHGKISGDEFIVNKMKYKLVIIPPGTSMFKTTFELLKEFVKNGGKVIAMEPLPYNIEGAKNSGIKELFKKATVINSDIKELEEAIGRILEKDVSVVNEEGNEIAMIYYQHRIDGKKHIYFFTNIDLKNEYNAEIRVGASGGICEYNLINGDIKEISSLNLKFAPNESHLIIVDEEKEQSFNVPCEEKLLNTVVLSKSWEYKRLDYNAVTLDYCEYKIRKGEWSKKMPVWKAQLEIRRIFGLNDQDFLRSNSYVQFWKDYENINVHETAHTYMKFHFNVKDKPKKTYLVLEIPERFDISVNGKKAKYVKKENDWWVDKTFKKVDISKLLRKGNNEILLHCLFRKDIEFESIYIAGDFGVYSKDDKKFYIGKEPKILKTGDWVKQGYKFFGGEMEYIQDVNLKKKKNEKVYLELERMDAVVMKVAVNGKDAGLIGWKPLKTDITKFVKNGKNKIELEVVSSLRNLMGPHHEKKTKKRNWCSAHSFSNEGMWTDKYIFVPYGILGETRINICQK